MTVARRGGGGRRAQCRGLPTRSPRVLVSRPHQPHRSSGGDRSPVSLARRHRSQDAEDAATSPHADVEAPPTDRRHARRSPSPDPFPARGDPSPLRGRPGSAGRARDSGATALLSPTAGKGGGSGGLSDGSPPRASTPPSRRSLLPLIVTILLCIASLAAFGADRHAAAPRPRCAATYGLRAWGAPNPANNWLNVTIDIDLSATGNVPFYAPYEVALSDGAYLRVLRTWNVNVTKPTAYSRITGTVGNWWMHLQPGARPLGLGLTVEVWQGDGAPRALTVNGVQCSLARRTPPPPGPTPAVRAEAGRLVDTDTGDDVYMAGVNYMGYEYGLTMFDGIGAAFKSRESLSQDLPTVAYRMRLLGINAVRLPFDFHSVMTRAADAAQLPCYSVSQSDVVAATADPTARRAHTASAPPP